MEPVRVDKWLWAARLVKTRALASEAVKGGRVHLDGARVKPSKEIRGGETLTLSTGDVRRTVVVLSTARQRGPAKVAELLYEETPESIEARERRAAERRTFWAAHRPEGGARPTKRDRRRFDATPGVVVRPKRD